MLRSQFRFARTPAAICLRLGSFVHRGRSQVTLQCTDRALFSILTAPDWAANFRPKSQVSQDSSGESAGQ
jgi:hypothetical protein